MKPEMGENPQFQWPIEGNLTNGPIIIFDPPPWIINILRTSELLAIYKIHLRYQRQMLEAQMQAVNEIMEIIGQVRPKE